MSWGFFLLLIFLFLGLKRRRADAASIVIGLVATIGTLAYAYHSLG